MSATRPSERALVFLPGTDAVAAGAACMEYARESGYRIEGVVIGSWGDVVSLLVSGAADLVIVADRCHLPTDRTPRVEIVAETVITKVARPPSYGTVQESPTPARQRARRLR